MTSNSSMLPGFNPHYQQPHHQLFSHGAWEQPLPAFHNAFMHQQPSPSPSAHSYETDSNFSEYLSLMEDVSSPSPSDVSTAPGDYDASEQELMDVDIEEMISKYLKDEMEMERISVCHYINIGPDPFQWSIEEVDRWMRWIHQEHELAEFNMDYFHMDGYSLCTLTEKDFIDRAPKAAHVIYPKLDFWKAAARPIWTPPQPVIPHPQPVLDIPVPQTSYLPFDIANIKTEPQPEQDADAASVVSTSSDEQSVPSPSTCGTGPDTSMTPNHTGSIHLWQFLKELLLQPESYGYCIRWLDREQGIFKIEDSVKVANLWGRRKNRPAMNYDKMSRSIRQYYKKKIMKKTEVSQRLVYQFVKPC